MNIHVLMNAAANVDCIGSSLLLSYCHALRHMLAACMWGQSSPSHGFITAVALPCTGGFAYNLLPLYTRTFSIRAACFPHKQCSWMAPLIYISAARKARQKHSSPPRRAASLSIPDCLCTQDSHDMRRGFTSGRGFRYPIYAAFDKKKQLLGLATEE